ncbi:MAG: BON domain-containing protein [Candidatus Binatia bacterium]
MHFYGRKYIGPFVPASLVALALGGFLAGCGEREGTGEPGGRAGDVERMAKEGGMSNSDLENRIKEKLAADERLKTANIDVSADAGKNEATLSGTVQSETERNRAVELAKSAQSGLVVNDKIDVKPREAT